MCKHGYVGYLRCLANLTLIDWLIDSFICTLTFSAIRQSKFRDAYVDYIIWFQYCIINLRADFLLVYLVLCNAEIDSFTHGHPAQIETINIVKV